MYVSGVIRHRRTCTVDLATSLFLHNSFKQGWEKNKTISRTSDSVMLSFSQIYIATDIRIIFA